MNIAGWRKLLGQLRLDTSMGELAPVVETSLDDFEKRVGVTLPNSYRAYCLVFGAGRLAERVKIAVPGYQGTDYASSLVNLDSEMAHAGLDFEEYSPDPAQHKRAIFVGFDVFRSYHFFDPADVTDAANNEYAVYTIFDPWEVRRTADNFWLFVTELCLGDKHTVLYGDPSDAPQVFTPID
jgi:hypothetical protein